MSNLDYEEMDKDERRFGGKTKETWSSKVSFGVCPCCGDKDGYRHNWKEVWFICHMCKTKWYGGYGLFSAYTWMSNEELKEHHDLMESYTEVEPFWVSYEEYHG